MSNHAAVPFNRLVLRAVLNGISPIVARVIAVADGIELVELHEIFLSLLGWEGDPGFIIRIHAQEFNSFQRRTPGKRLRDFQLRRQEKFLYVCDTLDLWEWEIRVLDIQAGVAEQREAVCLQGRGAVPPEHCGGARGYRLMLKRQSAGPGIRDPALIAASVKALATIEPDIDGQGLEETLIQGWNSIEERLERSGPLDPNRFSLSETNARLAQLAERKRRWR